MNKNLSLRKQQFLEAQKRHQAGDILGALRIYELISKELQSAEVYTYWALALLQTGRETEALIRAEEAVRMLPERDAVPERTVLATVFRRLGRLTEAERLLREALNFDPGNAAAINNLAIVLMQMGSLEEANTLFAEAMKKLPEDAAPALNRCRIALAQRDFAQAEAMLVHAKNAQPGHQDIPLLEARLALMEGDKLRASEAIFKCLAKQPTHPEAWPMLTTLEPEHIPFERLEALLTTIVRLKPTSAKLLGMAVGMARRHLVWKPLPELEAMLNEALENNQDAVIEVSSMFLLLSANISQKAHRVAAHNGFEIFIARGRNDTRPSPRPLGGRKLKVGYLSSDLRAHALGYLTVGVMEAHRESKTCEFIAYSNWQDDGSEIRRRMRAAFSQFVNITELSDKELAERIRSDNIDVLVDLNQITAGTRVAVFCYGPAPVTIQWLGMPGTVGAGNRIDYVIMDAWTLHPGNIDGFDESPVILAGSYQPNDHQRPDLSLCKSRADWNLPEKVPVLCSFNQQQKFSPDTIALWADIMRAVPDSVLWVLAGNPNLEERFLRIFEKYGIARERIIFAERVAHDVHIARIKHADLMLDNWPYNAHTTCSDALRAGCPVITLPGKTFASRVAASILDASNLSSWIAQTPEDYVEKAIAYLSRPRSEIEEIKRVVYETYWSSPQVDTTAFARRLESFYLAAYERVLSGKKPMPAWVSWIGDVNWGLPPFDAWRETVLANRPDRLSEKIEESNIKTGCLHQYRTLPEWTPDNDVKDTETFYKKSKKLYPTNNWQSRIQKGSLKARLNNLKILAFEILELKEPPLVVDVGASFESKKLIERLAELGLVRILGFEPLLFNPDSSLPNRIVLPYALGDGTEKDYRLCSAPGMSSLLEPDRMWLRRFPKFSYWSEVKEVRRVNTIRLDEVAETKGARFMKIDTQGSELTILQNGIERLRNHLVLIELELSPVPLYVGEASLFKVGSWLEAQGWVLHNFVNIDRRMMKPFGRDDSPFLAINHIFQVDAVFMPHPDFWVTWDEERLRNFVFLVHALYGSRDVAAAALDSFSSVGGTSLLQSYLNYLTIAGVDA